MNTPALTELWLLRHAKAADPESGQRDFDRPLTRKGRAQCEQVSIWLRDALAERSSDSPPLKVRVSPARRARQTAAAVLEDWFHGSVESDSRIWAASEAQLRELAREHAGALMLVGHNPGLEQLEYTLTGQLRPLPTAGLVVLEFTPDGPTPARTRVRFQP